MTIRCRPGQRRRSSKSLRPRLEALEVRTVLSLNLAPLVAMPCVLGVVGISGVAVDSSGDTYVTGTLSNGSTNLSPNGSAVLSVGPGSSEGFVAKYSPTGQFLWDQIFAVKFADGQEMGGGNGLTLDSAGDAIVTGFEGTAIYVAKYTSTGALAWGGEIFGNPDDTGYPDSGNAVAIDPAGNIYVAGYFAGASLAFGGTASTLTRQGVQDGFVVKLSSTGSPIWSWDDGVSGDFFESLRGIAVDSAGESFVTGYGSNGGSVNSVYIAKLSAAGNYVTGGIYGSGSLDSGAGVAIDALGNVYVVGTISSGSAYWGGNVGTVNYPDADNFFVLRMNESATALNGTYAGNAFGAGVAVSGATVYVTGYVQNSEFPLYVAFGTSADPMSSSFQYGTSGTVASASAIAVNASGQIALAGAYSGSLPLDRGGFPSETRSTAFLATSGIVAAPPSVTTGIAVIASTSCTLNASVNPESGSTTVSFVYGTNPTLSSATTTTAQQSIGSGNSVVAVSAALTGLAPNTTYYYEVVATNAEGTTDSPILSFTTMSEAPTATTEAATAITGTLATLNASVNPEGSATTISFVYGISSTLTTGTTTTPGQSIGNETNSVSVTGELTGLLPGTTYYFRVVASSVGGTTDGSILTFTTNASQTPEADILSDFDGFGHSEQAVYRPATSQWFVVGPNGTQALTPFGWANLNDIPVPGDYDGVGHTEEAVYRPSTGQWFVLEPNGTTKLLATFGWAGVDIPVPGDYLGLGYDQPAVYRPTTGQWFVLEPNGSTDALATFGWAGHDIPVPGDYDGVGHTEPAIYRPATSQWFVLEPNGSTEQLPSFGWANLNDLPAPGDYDGVGHTEQAVYRPSTSQWFVLEPNGTTEALAPFGWSGLNDLPVTTPVYSLMQLGLTGGPNADMVLGTADLAYANPAVTTAVPPLVQAASSKGSTSNASVVVKKAAPDGPLASASRLSRKGYRVGQSKTHSQQLDSLFLL